MRAAATAMYLIVLMASGGALAGDSTSPCTVGAYMISLYDLDMTADSFSADFWFWSTCDTDIRPLDVMDFPGSKRIETRLPASSFRDGLHWSYVKVSGVFRYDWNLRNYPFDRHALTVEIEHTAAPSSIFSYTADRDGSKPGRDIELDGWVISDFTIDEYTYVYDTVFGDPAFSGKDESDYSRLRITTSVHRKSIIGFFKLTAGVYISFSLAMLSFFLWSETGARTGLLVGTLFAVLVNQRVAESVLGRVEAFTLIDQIHVTAMAFIFAAAVGAILIRALVQRDRHELAKKLDRLGVIGSCVFYIAVNVIIIRAAALAG